MSATGALISNGSCCVECGGYSRRFIRCWRFTLLAWLLLDDFAGHFKQVLAAGLYVSNWTRAFAVPMPDWLGHTWSLSIEEQFYLLWPLLLLGILRAFKLSRLALLVIILAAVAFAWWRAHLVLEGANNVRLYNGTDTRADALLLGCALGVALKLDAIRLNPLFVRTCAALAGPIVLFFAFKKVAPRLPRNF